MGSDHRFDAFAATQSRHHCSFTRPRTEEARRGITARHEPSTPRQLSGRPRPAIALREVSRETAWRRPELARLQRCVAATGIRNDFGAERVEVKPLGGDGATDGERRATEVSRETAVAAAGQPAIARLRLGQGPPRTTSTATDGRRPLASALTHRIAGHCRRSRSRGILPRNVTAAAGRRKSRTKQGATLGSPRIDRP
jgi:hypothetical protein